MSEAMPNPDLFPAIRFNHIDPQTILQLAMKVLGMRTTFYAHLSETTLVAQDVRHAPESSDHCVIAAGSTAPLRDTYCQFVYRSAAPMVVPDSRHTVPFAHLMTTQDCNIGSYAGVPLVRQDGTIYGTLCGIDPEAQAVSEDQIALLQMLGHALMVGIERMETLQLLEEQRADALLALRDSLTGLPNRRAFDRAIDAAVVGASVNKTPLTLIFADVDRFKQINDTYGHTAGDQVLRLVAARLNRIVGGNERVFRYGGEELVILLPGVAADDGVRIAEQLRQGIAAPIRANEVDLFENVITLPSYLSVTASFGVATYPTFVASATELLQRADTAMYLAKRRGRNHVCSGDPQHLPTDLPNSNAALDRAAPQRQVVDALLIALAARDGVTGTHAERVTGLTEMVARQLGRQDDDVLLASLAARLHDIGKLGIPDGVLNKPGPLNDAEWLEMRNHPVIGMNMLRECGGQLGKLANIVVAHHERWDGTGYPFGLKGEAIPIEARVIAVVDAFDAMTSDRPYRQALTPAEAATELRRHAGSQFDPDVVAAFLTIIADELPDADGVQREAA